jgi:hypothetical protein
LNACSNRFSAALQLGCNGIAAAAPGQKQVVGCHVLFSVSAFVTFACPNTKAIETIGVFARTSFFTNSRRLHLWGKSFLKCPARRKWLIYMQFNAVQPKST